MPSRKQEMSAQSRQRILGAALDLFGQRGYRETSIQDIAEAAGISRGSIAWHFGSKAGLLVVLVEQEAEQLVNQWLAELPDAGQASPSLESIEAWIERYREAIETNSENSALLPMLLHEALRPSSAIRDQYASLYRRLRGSIEDRIRQAQEARILQRDLEPAATATVLFGALIGIHLQWRLDPAAVNLSNSTRSLTALLRNSHTTKQRRSRGTS